MPARGEAANLARQVTAGERDRDIARAIYRPRFPLSARQAAVVLARMNHPGETWQVTADYLGMTKAQAWGIWRNLMHRADVIEAIDELDRR